MKIISIINLKGGVAKTLTADNMAHVLAVFHNKRVLLVDNDKQGNTSKAFGVHSYDDKSLSDVLTARRLDVREVIKKTRFENIDVLPANMTLIRANMEVLMDTTRPQQTRLRAALDPVAGQYDFCIIDNAPDINISTINALVASTDRGHAGRLEPALAAGRVPDYLLYPGRRGEAGRSVVAEPPGIPRI